MDGGYLGIVNLGDDLPLLVQARNASLVPTHADALPSYRVYGESGLVTGQTGSLAQRESGAVTGATNASPIVLTSAGHGLTTGQRAKVASVGGNTAANGTFQVTRVSDDAFSLDGSTGNAPYTSGGTWATAGLYSATLTASDANGYESGKTYTVVVGYVVGGTPFTDVYSFTVA